MNAPPRLVAVVAGFDAWTDARVSFLAVPSALDLVAEQVAYLAAKPRPETFAAWLMEHGCSDAEGSLIEVVDEDDFVRRDTTTPTIRGITTQTPDDSGAAAVVWRMLLAEQAIAWKQGPAWDPSHREIL